jgi:SAM-dependent methyltransferase
MRREVVFEEKERRLRPMKVVVYQLKKYLCGRVLDAGCGDGRHLILMPEGSIGLDIEIKSHWLREKYGLVRADLNRTLPFSNGVFDVIFCSHTFEHLESPYRTLKEFHRVLKSGGVVNIGNP